VKHGNLNPKLTTLQNPIKVYWKYIKNEKFSLYYFFNHRGIRPDIDFLYIRYELDFEGTSPPSGYFKRIQYFVQIRIASLLGSASRIS